MTADDAYDELAQRLLNTAAAELARAGCDPIYAAHALFRAALLGLMAAAGPCPSCTAHELRIAAGALDELIEAADDAADGAPLEHLH